MRLSQQEADAVLSSSFCAHGDAESLAWTDQAQAAVLDARGSNGRWAASEYGLTSARGRGLSNPVEGVLGAADPAGGRLGALLLFLRARRRRAFGADETLSP